MKKRQLKNKLQELEDKIASFQSTVNGMISEAESIQAEIDNTQSNPPIIRDYASASWNDNQQKWQVYTRPKPRYGIPMTHFAYYKDKEEAEDVVERLNKAHSRTVAAVLESNGWL